MEELSKYIGMAKIEKKLYCEVIVICGINELDNSLIGISLGVLDGVYKRIKEEDLSEFISLSEAYYKFKNDNEKILDLGKKIEVCKNSENSQDFTNTMFRFSEIMNNIIYLKRAVVYYSKEEDKKMILDDLRKAKKGLHRIKKRTYHYLSDMDIDYIIDNFDKDFRLKNVSNILYNYSNIIKILDKMKEIANKKNIKLR